MAFYRKPDRLRFVGKAMLVLLASFLLCVQTVVAREDNSVQYEENGALGLQLRLPLYHWWNAAVTPRATVVAMHGLTLHGRTFDTLARTLAGQGFEVYAMDMRGYGRSMKDDPRYCFKDDSRKKIDYNKSYADLVRLLRCLRTQGSAAPVFAVGESLGAAMAIRLAAGNPDLIDGLVLSSPAIKRHSFLDPYAIADTAVMCVDPCAQVDLMPFVRRYMSDDPKIIAEKESDPLLRRSLSAFELMESDYAVRKTARFVSHISADLPVLVIQGSADRCVKANAVMLLLSRLHSTDQTVKWFPERGHILLETAYVKPDTLDAVVSWLDTHASSPTIQARHQRVDGIMAHEIPPPVPVFSARAASVVLGAQ